MKAYPKLKLLFIFVTPARTNQKLRACTDNYWSKKITYVLVLLSKVTITDFNLFLGCAAHKDLGVG